MQGEFEYEQKLFAENKLKNANKTKGKKQKRNREKKISTKIRIENIYENISICTHCTHVRAYCKYIHFCKVNGKSDRDRESVMKNKTEKNEFTGLLHYRIQKTWDICITCVQ